MKKLLFLFTILLLVGCADTTENEVTRKTVLVEKAKKDTLERLKSPSSAEFLDSTATVIQLKGEDGPSDSYRVNISVDAQNNMGAKIRNRYTLIYKETGNDSLNVNNYELKDFF